MSETSDAEILRVVDSRLTEFFYLLIRDEMAFGSVKGLLRKMTPAGSVNSYCSPGGELLARELVHELMTGEKPEREQQAERGELVTVIGV